jgi:Major tropism determinant N-terminal domain
MAQTIQFRRGSEANLPSLAPGEPAVTLDTEKLYIGTPQGNVAVPKQEDVEQLSSQMAQKQTIKKHYDYVDYLTKSANLSRKMSVKMGNPNYKYFDVSIPTSDTDGIYYLFGKDTNDDYQLLLNGDYGNLVKSTSITESKNPETELMGGTTDKNFPPNYWTATVDNWIATSFVGTKIAFNSFCDNRGGLWEFILDEGTAGEQRVNISVYSATNVAIKQQVLFQNLTPGKHTIKGVFKGQDPANPVATPRGWWYFGGTAPQYVTRTFDVYNEVTSVSPTVKCLYNYTVKEFALSCRPYGTTEAFTYIPEHTAPTAFKLEEPLLLLDGKAPIWKEGNIYPGIECVQLIQKLKGIHPSDPTNPLMEIRIIQTIKNGVYSVSGRVNFLRKTELDVGYAIMFGYDNILAKKIKTGLGNVYTVKTNGSKDNIPDDDKSYSFCVVNDVETGTKEDLAIACTVDNVFNTQREDKASRGTPFSWVEHRNTAMGKLYMQQFKNAVIEAGEEYRFDGRYMICKIPKVNKYVL